MRIDLVPIYPHSVVTAEMRKAFCAGCDHALNGGETCREFPQTKRYDLIYDEQGSKVEIGICSSASKNGIPGSMGRGGRFTPVIEENSFFAGLIADNQERRNKK